MSDSALTPQAGANPAARPQVPCEPTVAEVEAELERLAGLSKYAYEREHDAAARRLGMPVDELNVMVYGIQDDWKSSGNGWRIQGTTANSRNADAGIIRNWPDPVSTADLLPQLVAAIHRHVVISDDAALTTALWIMHCHALDAFETSPRLIIASGEPASGKSTLLDLLGQMVPPSTDLLGRDGSGSREGNGAKPGFVDR